MIIQPQDITFDKEPFSMLIYGSPNIGKTTLAMTAPNPLLIDLEHGYKRTSPAHRCQVSWPTNPNMHPYEEIKADVENADAYETIIFDTGAALIQLMKDWAAKKKGTVLRNGEFDMRRGFGVVNAEFESLTSYIKNVLKKNIIYLFHPVESQDNAGNSYIRLMCEGKVKNTVWNSCDFGAYYQYIGNKRTLCFQQTDEYFTKHCHRIDQNLTVPEFPADRRSAFLTDEVFSKAHANIEEENKFYAAEKEQYKLVMDSAKQMIETITDAESATRVCKDILALKHALTSKKECSNMLKQKASSLGLRYNKSTDSYIPKEDQSSGAV